MLSFARSLRWVRGRHAEPTAPSVRAADRSAARPSRRTPETPHVDIAPNDPLVMYLMSAPGPVALDGLQLDSPALRDLRAAGVKLVVPLVSQGELIGTFNLGPHLSDQDYSVDDRRLLDKLAAGAVPRRVKESLHGRMPSNTFVTGLFALLDPVRGRLRFANAGHDLPDVRRAAGVVELRATGMPLGIMADSRYAEAETILAPGEGLLLHSDGLAEAHAPDHAMFGFPRLRDEMGRHQGGQPLIDGLLEALDRFTGPGWAQEDDITLVTLTRSARSEPREIASFVVPSRAGNERVVMDRVAEAITAAGIDMPGLARIKTAVSEAAMNAIEHSNRFSQDVPVGVQVLATDDEVLVRITDSGGDRAMPEPSRPDLEAKLAGRG